VSEINIYFHIIISVTVSSGIPNYWIIPVVLSEALYSDHPGAEGGDGQQNAHHDHRINSRASVIIQIAR
jgi:hypothetical protein